MTKKNNTYWYRRRVKKLGEVVLSLKTKSYEMALLRHAYMDFQITKLLFQGTLDKMTVQEIRDIIKKYKTYFEEDEYNEFEEQRDKDLSITLNGNFFGGHTKEALAYAMERYHTIHASNDIERIKEETARILPRTNLQDELPKLLTKRDEEIFHWELFKAEWDLLSQAYEAQKIISKTPDTPSSGSLNQHPDIIQLFNAFKEQAKEQIQSYPVNNGWSITRLLDEYIREKGTTNDWSSKNYRDLEYVLGNFAEWFNDKPVKLITRQDFIDFRDDALAYLPKTTKYNGLKDKSIREVVQIVKTEKITAISKTTINKHLRRLHQVFEWASKCGYIDKNLSKELSFNEKKGYKDARDDKNPYSNEELKLIFEQSPWFTDKITIQLKNKPENIFIPLLCLYTGAKPIELALLEISDITTKSDILGFEFTKRAKTSYCYRFTPISNALIDIGFMKFVAYQKKHKHKKLFPNIKLYGDDGTSFTNEFARYNRAHITQVKKKTFYSIRHYVSQALKNKLVPIYAVNDITGHSDGHGNKDISVYGDRLQEEVLQEVINQHLVYDFIDFSHIKEAIQKTFS